MVPILIGLIIGQKDTKKHKAFLLSLSYVFGMAVTYAIAGMITAVLGNSVQAILQNVWMISACSIIFVLLSLSLFGLYEIQLPSFLLNRLNNAANKTKTGSYIGVFLMGAISSLIVSPCVSAPLAGTLIYIASTGNILLGGSALFVLALGMGVLLIIAGTSGGKLLVKSGGWMQIVRYFLGVVMLFFAVWMLGRVITNAWTNLLYGLLLVGIAIYMGALEPSEQGSWKRFVKMIAFFIMIAGLGITLQFFIPQNNVSQNRTNELSNTSNGEISVRKETSENTVFSKVTNLDQMNKLIKKAAEEGKPVIIDYYADWCTACKEMENGTFKDPNVLFSLKDFVAIKADITKNNEDSAAIKKKYKVFAPPYIVFLSPDGKEIKQLSIAGEVNAEALNEKLQMVLSVYTSK
jgi:thioredoxin:protein disulfide reductase